MVKDYPTRSDADSEAERLYLQSRLAQIESGMGRVAARQGSPTPITQEMDALDRARELVNDMLRQVHVQPLDEALTAQIAWLDRAEERQGRDDGEPTTSLNRIALDRRLLGDLLEGWQSNHR